MNLVSVLEQRNGRVLLLIALALLMVLTGVAIVSRPITPIDETRYVGVAWEMWLRGDFLVPHKNGEPYSHKPPLMMWMFHAGWWVFGVNAWWPRLVSPLFSAGALLLTYGLARRLWPGREGLGGPAALVLVTCLVWSILSTWIMFDVMLAFFALVSMHGILDAADGKRLRGFALMGLGMGLGLLAKGPAMLLQVLPVTVLAPWWRPGLRWAAWYGGILLAVLMGAVIVLSWAIPAGMAGGEAYQHAIFWGQTANRMVESFAHQRPVWWYLVLLPALLFPWIMWPSLWRGLSQYLRRQLDEGGRFCIAWALPVFIAFSLISGKQVHYLIPLFPAFALLVARVISNERGNAARSGELVLPLLLVALTGLALLLVVSGHIEFDLVSLPAPSLVAGGVALIAISLGAYFWHRHRPRSLIFLSLAGVSVPVVAQLAVTPFIYPAYDVRPIAQAIRQLQDKGELVAHAGKYHDQYHFFGRLHKPLIEMPAEEISAWLTQHPQAWVVLYLRDTRLLVLHRPVMSQPFRGKTAVLLDGATAQRLLARLKALPAPD